MFECYCVSPAQKDDWKAICSAFAKKVGAELLFVNESSCGLEYPNGSFSHIYIEEMAEYIKTHSEDFV